MPKKTVDLSAKHFSRYGEFLASFELSKHGWDVYTPVYDEYIDLIVHKVVCKDCKKYWNTNPKLICQNCHKEVTKTNKNGIIADLICKKCKKRFSKKSRNQCPNCGNKEFENYPACPFCKKGIIKIEENNCPHCNSKNHMEKFRTIQIKASRIESKGNSYAVDLRPRDLTQAENHFYVWVCIGKEERPHFLVIPLKEFQKEAKSFINSISFLKDQGREHFNSKNFGKWEKYLDKFEVLE